MDAIPILVILFVDDIVLLAENPKDLQHLLDVAYSFGMRWGFSWNQLGEVYIIRKDFVTQELYLGLEELKQVNSCKYLGIELDHRLNHKLAREMIRRKARKCIVLASNAFRKGLDFKAGERIWLSVVKPTLMFGSEIWSARKEADLERLQLQVGKALLGVGKSCASEMVNG